MGALTTHVLDISAGKPGAGMRIDLYRVGTSHHHLLTMNTNADGRPPQPLVQGDAFERGEYELVFHAGEYFSRQGVVQTEPPFLGQVVIRFGVADAAQHYHVPLLLSPYGYSTYRGS